MQLPSTAVVAIPTTPPAVAPGSVAEVALTPPLCDVHCALVPVNAAMPRTSQSPAVNDRVVTFTTVPVVSAIDEPAPTAADRSGSGGVIRVGAENGRRTLDRCRAANRATRCRKAARIRRMHMILARIQ